MFKRLTFALTALMTLIWSMSCSAAAKPDKWLIYWYVCGTDIETTRIAFQNGTNLMSGQIILDQPDREPGDATRCIKEVEKATLSPDVRIFMQAGGTYIWGHEKFRDLNARVETKVVVVEKIEEGKISTVEGTAFFGNNPKTGSNVSVKQWFLTGGGGHTEAKPVPGGNGKLGRYVYDKIHRNWYPREQLPISGEVNTETDMGSKAGFVSFLRAGQKLEQELYPDVNVHRVLIIKDHGSGIGGVCVDEYTENTLSLQEMKSAFREVNNGWVNPDEKPFEVVAFDACIMSVYETALALEDFANYMVASQESTDGKVGLNYTELLNDLSKDTSMSGKKLSKIICDTRWEDSKNVDKEFSGLNTTGIFTESVIDLSENKMDALKTAYANFIAEALKVAKQNPDDVVYTFAKFQNAANTSERFPIISEGYTPDMVDLKNFAENVRDTFPELKKAGNELVKAVDNSVVYNKRSNAYKRGGGISVYYPFDVISAGAVGYNNFKFNVENRLSSENPSGLYEYLIDGVTQELRLVNGQWEISEDSAFNLSELASIRVEVDEDKKTATIELDEDEQKGVEGVRYMLSLFVPRNDDNEKFNMLVLGEDSDIKEDRATGTFELTLKDNKKWLLFEDQPLAIQVVSDATRKNKSGKKISGNDICITPILLNGEPYKLFLSRSYPNEKITVIGAVPNVNGQVTLPSGRLESLKKGDIVTPLYIYVKDVKAETMENSKPFNDMTAEEKIKFMAEITGKGRPITIGDKLKFEMAPIRNGIFGYFFEFVNPIGNNRQNNVLAEEGAICKIKNGKIVTVKHSDDVEKLSDLEK
ncbi:MAG: hypothetical protein IJT73_08840 [Selenomonadaceae bacterium]|nr:hypothetical protein [Selenomonadaceae bacterium]